jgi:2-keto-4-pentenoate hydratase/2-oxohepta-3-ene-1,7-dioic acid hydratase in catechol pathway
VRYGRVTIAGVTRWARIEADTAVLLAGDPWTSPADAGRVRLSALAAPFTGTKIVAIGSNYRDHAAEMGKPIPTVPKIFLKAPSAVVGPEAAIEVPPGTQRVDHEAELAVVIGRRCRRVSAADAMGFVFGYTVLNDVTARDFQKEDGVFARAKGFDTFCPVGPWIETDLDPAALAVTCRVDGVVRQAGNTRDMVFDVATLIAFVSNIMTLEPGDLISTGTPAGVGPLQAGQVVEVEVDGIGVLRNPVVDREDR